MDLSASLAFELELIIFWLMDKSYDIYIMPQIMLLSVSLVDLLGTNYSSILVSFHVFNSQVLVGYVSINRHKDEYKYSTRTHQSSYKHLASIYGCIEFINNVPYSIYLNSSVCNRGADLSLLTVRKNI